MLTGRAHNQSLKETLFEKGHFLTAWTIMRKEDKTALLCYRHTHTLGQPWYAHSYKGVIIFISYCDCKKNYHKVSHFKQHEFIIMPFCRSELQHSFHWTKIRCQWAVFLLEALGDNLFPHLFQLLVVTSISWLMASFHLKSQQSHHSNLCFHYHFSFLDSESPVSLFHL